jgi:conjugal transfer pilus assembly protein TraF
VINHRSKVPAALGPRSLRRKAVLALVLLAQVWAPFPSPAMAQSATSDGPPAAVVDQPGVEEAGVSDVPPAAGQDPFYCGERRLGTWFYCDRPRDKDSAKGAAPSSATATERLALITRQLDELRAKAILEPTTQNVAAYIRYQREQLDRASTFADTWQRALWQDPGLDYTLQRPVNSLGKDAWLEQRKNDQANTMAALSKRYGIFFFYSSSCGACEAFGPVVRQISDQFNLSVLPVSMDGGPNRYFKHFVVNQGQYEKMGLSGGMVPALVLFDTVLKKPIPIGYGAMAADEVMDRIFRLTSVKVGSDF